MISYDHMNKCEDSISNSLTEENFGEIYLVIEDLWPAIWNLTPNNFIGRRYNIGDFCLNISLQITSQTHDEFVVRSDSCKKFLKYVVIPAKKFLKCSLSFYLGKKKTQQLQKQSNLTFWNWRIRNDWLPVSPFDSTLLLHTHGHIRGEVIHATFMNWFLMSFIF